MSRPARALWFSAGVFISLLALSSYSGLSIAQQPYPHKPIKVVVPYAPGGATDIMARLVTQKLTDVLGQPVLVENKPGANTGIGAEAVAKSAADGYTLMFTNDATFVLNPALWTALPYNMARDFAPVASVAYLNLSLVVAENPPAKNFTELVAWTKSKSGTISYGSYGVGSQAHLMGEMFKNAFFAPAGTPREVVAKLNAAVATLLSNREFVDGQLGPQGMVAMNLSTDQVAALMRTESERMSRMVKLSGAKVE